VRDWVEGYVRAWTSNDPDEIRALFTEDARYYTAPYREPWEGHEGIVGGWLEAGDEPDEWSFGYEVLAVADGLAFVRGRTEYEEATYSNLWVIRLEADGRCSEFTEWWVKHR
jgi:hypothetical protein